MCGITGWVNWQCRDREAKNVVETMMSSLAQRGPDERSHWITGDTALGHTRLAVIDLQGGKQPMIRDMGCEKYVISYNGELYNTRELKNSLKQKGYKFATDSDTEVVLHAYIHWGEKSLDFLDGIFAFAIWEDKAKTLFLARDRLGVKPLFFSKRGKSVIFGSEIKALLSHPLISPQVDTGGLAEIFAMGPSRTPGCGVFKGVSELKPGHYMIIKDGAIQIHQYWQLESSYHRDGVEETAEKVRDLFINAVRKQLVSDVPIGTFLSGGLDSSAITAIAAENIKNVKTYAVEYQESKDYFEPSKYQPSSDEPWIKEVSQYFNTDHSNIYLEIDELLRSLEDAVIARDLPGMADIDSSLLLFCGQVKRELTVVLSGECADEIFGGYPWFNDSADSNLNNFPWMKNIYQRESILSEELRHKINPRQYINNRFAEAIKEVPIREGESDKEKKMRQLFYLNLTRWMPTLLDRKDRMSMAVGLEVRVPFCDHHLVEYAWNIPWEIKNIENREKGILRKALQGVLPEEVLWRKKSPYPKTHNPTYSRAVQESLRYIISDGSVLEQLLDKQFITGLLNNKNQGGNEPWFGQLMGRDQLFAFLIQVDIWFRKYKIKVV